MARRGYQRRRAEATIALINVIFLMLVFFLVAGTIAPKPPAEVTLVRLAEADPLVPPDVLAVFADGRTVWRGEAASPAAYLAGLPEDRQGIARLLPDRDLPALRLVEIAAELRAAGAREVRIVTERGAP